MCVIYNGYYKASYEIEGGRRCGAGEKKLITLALVNHTGSQKFRIHITCAVTDPAVALERNGLTTALVDVDVLLPPAYLKPQSSAPTGTQIIESFTVSAQPAEVPFVTELHGHLVVEAAPTAHDQLRRIVLRNFPRHHDFAPPLEVTP